MTIDYLKTTPASSQTATWSGAHMSWRSLSGTCFFTGMPFNSASYNCATYIQGVEFSDTYVFADGFGVTRNISLFGEPCYGLNWICYVSLIVRGGVL